MKFLTLVLGLCAAAAAQAATIELNLTGDATLAAALSAYNAANGTSYADTDGGTSLGANDVEVKGSGTLTFSTALGSWTGKLTVKSGAKARVVINQQTVLGNATTGAVYVEDGATLILDHSVNVGNGHQISRPIHIAGNGAAAGENGALKLVGNNSSYRSATPKALYLDADATLSFGANTGVTGSDDHQFIADQGEKWYLQGHKLTVTNKGWPRAKRLTFFWGMYVYGGNGGAEIDCDGVTALFRVATFDGGAENVFRLRNGAVYQLQATGNNLPKWTLVFEKTSGVSADIGLYQHYDILNDTTRNWQGPVVLSNVLAMANNSAYTNTMGFAGKISGPGGLRVSTTQPRDQHRFNLYGAGSDFTGGLAVTNHVIHLGAPDSVPAGAQAGAMLLKDCDVRFRYDPFGKADFAFPDTVFDGSGVFDTPDGAFPQGKFKSLVKTGSGTLELRTGLTGGDVEVRGGTLKLGCGRLDDFVGAMWGQSSAFTCYVNPFTSTATASDKQTFCPGTPIKDKALTTLYTDKFTTDLGIFSASVTTDGDKAAWQNTYYQKLTTYSGYLHNRTGADLTIRLVCTINAYVHLKIGSIEKFYPVDDNLSRNAGTFEPYGNETLTIPAGTSRFEIRVYDRFGLNSKDGNGKDFCYGNVRTLGLTNWDDRHGLMWTEKTDSTDMNDYHAFTDQTAALVFTTISDYTARTREVDALTGSGVLDLGGGELTAKSVSGALRVVNGTLNVTNGLAFGTGVSRLVGNVTNRAAVAGMVHGRISQPNDGPNAAAQAHFDRREILDGSVMTSLHYFYTPSSQMHSGGIFGRYPYVTYNGYLWNNTDQVQKWTVATTHDGFTRFAVNGVEYTSNYKWYTMWPNGGANGEWKEGCSTLWTDVTLKPGANKFTVYAAAQYTSAPYVGNVAFGEGTNWVDALGLAYDPENRKTFDKQYFSKFEDPGDGSLMTLFEVDEAVGCSYEKLSGVKGTVIDMNYGEAFVKDFAGVAVVSNGLLHLTGSLTMTAAEINDADACLDCVKFLEGATFDVSDAAADVKLSGKGRVVARHVVGDVCPALGPKLTAAGWTIALKDGEVRVFNKPGLLLFIR